MRLSFLDEIRGIAFILMIIHHVNYFKDVSSNYTTNYSSNPIISAIGTISRNIFIILVGFSLYESYLKEKNECFYQKKIKRIMNIYFHALIITVVSHLKYPQYGIKFGVLHFIATVSLLLLPLISNPKLIMFLGVITFIFKDYFPPTNNSIIDFLLGTKINYSMMDYFPLLEWFPLVSVGVGMSYLYHNKELISNYFLQMIGKNCLNLYTLHVSLLLLCIQ